MNVTWEQLLTEEMTPQLASIVMGVRVGIAEMELRRAADRMKDSERIADAVGAFLQSTFPTRVPRKRMRMDDLPYRPSV